MAAYVGWQSSSILKPLLQQGLSDTEEFVIYKALNALTCMCQLGLLQKPHIYEFVGDIGKRVSGAVSLQRLSRVLAVDVMSLNPVCLLPPAVAPFLCHPNLWIRYGAVGFITVVAQHLNVADVYCKLMPHLNPFITQPIIQVSPRHRRHARASCVLLTSSVFISPQIDKELVLLSVLKEPVSRSIFDYALRSKDIATLFRHLLLRQKKRAGTIPECPTPDDPAIAQLLKKLLSQVRTRFMGSASLLPLLDATGTAGCACCAMMFLCSNAGCSHKGAATHSFQPVVYTHTNPHSHFNCTAFSHFIQSITSMLSERPARDLTG